jgi:hypothetical protein
MAPCIATQATDAAAAAIAAATGGAPVDMCKMSTASLKCYPADCCTDATYKATIDALIAGLPAGCTAKCGAGAMATPAAALFAVVMSMFYRLM